MLNALNHTRILGIHPGLATTGYGIIDSSSGQSVFVECGLIQTDRAQSLAERLCHIQKNLQQVIDQWRPEEASIEQIFYHRNARSALLLGHSRGVACVTAAAAGMTLFEYAPRLVKLSVTGYGNADKEQVADMVKRIPGARRKTGRRRRRRPRQCSLPQPSAAKYPKRGESLITRLSGSLFGKKPPMLQIDVGGVGYEIFAPMSTFYSLPEIGRNTVLLTQLIVREDSHQLYGFATSEERELFRSLLRVNGIGPKVALAILSATRVPDFVAGVHSGDSALLARIPGIGKKTAQRIIVEMNDKLPDSAASSAIAAGSRGEAAAALAALGYRESEARQALDQIKLDEGAPAEEWIREALRALGGKFR